MRAIKLLLVVILGSPLLLIGGVFWLLAYMLKRPWWLAGTAALIVGSQLAAPLSVIVVVGGVAIWGVGILLDAVRSYE